MNSNAVKALNAIKTTSRLNLRIRLSYASAQLISVPFIGLRLAVPTNPLAFTGRYYQTGKTQMQQQNFPNGKTNLSRVTETLEIADDVSGRKRVLVCCKQIDTTKARHVGKSGLRP
jgi:hypothetical protein